MTLSNPAIHGPKVDASVTPRTGRIARCERCGGRVVAHYVAPSRRHQWRHEDTNR